jgi:hypothetical protein
MNKESRRKSYNKYDAKRRETDPHYYVKKIFRERRRVSANKGIPFDIEIHDILDVPNVCPILGIPMFNGGPNCPNNPSLDKIRPELGYTKGNIQWVSFRANRIKCDATLEEVEKLYKWYKENVEIRRP